MEPQSGQVVVAVVDGELVCRRLSKGAGGARLEAASADHADIVIAAGDPFELWGVVTTVIKSLLA
jgi:DNA polymerase V